MTKEKYNNSGSLKQHETAKTDTLITQIINDCTVEFYELLQKSGKQVSILINPHMMDGVTPVNMSTLSTGDHGCVNWFSPLLNDCLECVRDQVDKIPDKQGVLISRPTFHVNIDEQLANTITVSVFTYKQCNKTNS